MGTTEKRRINLDDSAATLPREAPITCLLCDLCDLCDLCVNPSLRATGTSPSRRSHALPPMANLSCGWLCRINTEIAGDPRVKRPRAGSEIAEKARQWRFAQSALWVPPVVYHDVGRLASLCRCHGDFVMVHELPGRTLRRRREITASSWARSTRRVDQSFRRLVSDTDLRHSLRRWY
jgi:hypothetical protein